MKIITRYKKDQMNKAALKITIAYCIIGFVWIYFSDYLLSLLSLGKKEVLFLQSVKGGLYVAITAILLYYLVNRYSKSLRKSTRQYKKLFKENPNPMWVYDKNTLEILEVNHVYLNGAMPVSGASFTCPLYVP